MLYVLYVDLLYVDLCGVVCMYELFVLILICVLVHVH